LAVAYGCSKEQKAPPRVSTMWTLDVIATPAVMFTPHVLTDEASPEKFWAHNRNIVHNLMPANYLALCAATLPVGLDRLGMPVGVQLIARGGDDERLVAIACAAERVLGTPREILGAPPMWAAIATQ